jgi:diguanylate cyclase (GGDEF)-like protein
MAGDQKADKGWPTFLTLVRRYFSRNEAEIQHELMELTDRFVLRGTLLALPSIALFVVTLWPQPARLGLLACAGLISLVSLGQVVVRSRWTERFSYRSRLWSRTAFMAFGGASWGSLSLFTVGNRSAGEWRAITAMLIVAVMAATTIFTSPSRRMFAAFQLGITTTSSLGFLIDGTSFGAALALVTLFCLLASAALHQHGNSTVVGMVRLSYRNRLLVEELHTEQVQLAAVNQDLVSANEQLARHSGRDILTGTANRAVFHQHIQRALRRSDRETGSTGTCGTAVLFIDVDHFKRINDTRGHEVGDSLLIEVASRISSELREGDVVARFGGDEFTVLLNDITGPEEAQQVSRRISDSIGRGFSFQGIEIKATVSIGAAIDDDDTGDPSTLLKRADAALYRAKRLGRNRVELFDESLRLTLANQQGEEAELRRAFSNNEIVPWFQPEVDLTTGEICGAEVLARWMHSSGPKSAGLFIPAVEQHALLTELSRAIGKNTVEAVKQMSQLTEAFRFHINLSPRYLTDDRWIESFLGFIEAESVSPSRFALEVTETALVEDISAAKAWLHKARKSGIKVFLDDFGTGYSSLGLFMQLPVDGLKVDMSFVSKIEYSKAARSIIGATAHLAQSMGLDIIAEGVETPGQRAALLDLGIHRAQGYLFSPAVAGDEFVDWVDSNKRFSVPDDAQYPSLESIMPINSSPAMKR